MDAQHQADGRMGRAYFDNLEELRRSGIPSFVVQPSPLDLYTVSSAVLYALQADQCHEGTA